MRNARRTPGERRIRRIAALVAVAACLGAPDLTTPAPLAGQERGDGVHGRVLDATTGEPVAGALVERLGPERVSVVTGEDGRFTIEAAAPPPHRIRVSRLGYRDALVVVEEPRPPVEVRLEPVPVVLEGLEVVADRFERRIRSLPVRTRVIRREDIVSANAIHGIHVLEQRAGFREIRCPRIRDAAGISRCFETPRNRGPFRLWIDEARSPFGLEELGSLSRDEIWRIELIGPREVRVYTTDFVERRARLAPRPTLPVEPMAPRDPPR